MPFHKKLFRTIGRASPLSFLIPEDEEEKKRRQRFQSSVSRLFGAAKEQTKASIKLATMPWEESFPKEVKTVRAAKKKFKKFKETRAEAPLLSPASASNAVKDFFFRTIEEQKKRKKVDEIFKTKLAGTNIEILFGPKTPEQKKKINAFLTTEEQQLLKEVEQDTIMEAGVGFMGTSARVGGVLAPLAKKLKLSPEIIADSMKKGTDPIARQVRKLLTKDAAAKLVVEDSLDIAKALISYEPKKKSVRTLLGQATNFRRFYFNFFDRGTPFWGVTKGAIKKKVKFTAKDDPNITFRRYLGVALSAEKRISYRTFTETRTGIKWSGEALADIVNDVGPNAENFNVFLTQRHLTELSPNIRAKQPELMAVFKDAVDKLHQKLTPDELIKFEQVASRFYSYQRRVLKETLLDSGVITQEMFDNFGIRYPKYIPLNRVMDDLAKQGIVSKTSDFLTPKTIPIKRLKGSEREIIDPLASMVGNVYQFSEVAMRNNVAKGVAKLGLQTPGSGIFLVKPKVAPVAKATHREVVDPVLSQDLHQFAKDIKVIVTTKLKTGTKLGKAWIKDPPEIQRMFGSRESTLAHEIGHVIDGQGKVLQRLLVDDKAINIELRKLADSRFLKGNVSTSFQKYIRKGEEKVAELVSLYVTNRTMARKLAPKAVRALEDYLTKNPKLARLKTYAPTNVETIIHTEEQLFAPIYNQPKGIIQFFDKGEKKYLKVPDMLYDAMTGMREETMNQLVKIAAIPTRMLRTGATLSPAFSTTNPVRDQWSAYINAEYGFKPGYDFTKAMFDIGRSAEVYHRWIASGGGQAQFLAMGQAAKQQTAKGLRRAAEAKAGGLTGKIVYSSREFSKYLNPLESLKTISMGMESPTRLAVFKNAYKKHGDFVAAYESREASTDFARRGALMQSYNAIHAFFNANLQHSDKMVRTMKDHPIRTAVRTAPITVVSGMLWYANRDDPRYDKIDAWKKNLFWIVMLPVPEEAFGPHYVMIPKGSAGIAFGTSFELILDWIDRREPERTKEMLGELIPSILPISDLSQMVPTIVKMPAEIAANRSFFTGLPIVPQSAEGLIASEQFSTATSETFKYLGKKLKMSPAKLEHFFTGYTASLGRMFVDLSDTALETLGVIDKKLTLPSTLPGEDIPVIGTLIKRWLGREPIGSADATLGKFYDETKRLDALAKTRNKFISEGRIEDAIRLQKSNPALLLSKDMVKVRTKFSNVRDLKEVVIASEELSEDEKRSIIRELNIYLSDIAEIMLILVKAVEAGKFPEAEPQRNIPSLTFPF